MRDDDYSNFGDESLDGLLHKLVEAQVKQTILLNRLTEVTESLAASERRESWGELFEGLSRYTKALGNAAASPNATPSRPPAQIVQPAVQPVVGDDELSVLGQYDELRAALGRTGAENFYVSATADRAADTLVVSGDAVPKADTLTVDGTSVEGERIGSAITVSNPPAGVYYTPSPVIRLSAGGRVIAVARYITVEDHTLTGLRG